VTAKSEEPKEGEKVKVYVSYLPIIRQPARLRLYLNDPEIYKHLVKGELPIPIELDGEFILAVGEDGKLHVIFEHETEGDGFLPVFLDLEGAELKFAELKYCVDEEVEG